MLVKISNVDMDNFVKYPKIIESGLGFWPSYKTKWSWLYKLYSHFITSMMWLGATSGTIDLLFVVDNISEAFEAAYILLTYYIALIKYMQALIRSKKYEQFLKDLENPLFESKNTKQRNMVLKWVKIAHLYGKILSISTVISIGLGFVYPIVDKRSEKIATPMRTWFPYDIYQSTPVFVLTYAWTNVILWIVGLVAISMDLHVCVFMNIGCAQIQILKDNLENCVEYVSNLLNEEYIKDDRNLNNIELLKETTEEELVKWLSTCIEHHQLIKKLFKDIETIFNPALLIQILENGILLCMCGMELLLLPIFSVQAISTVIYFSISIGQLILLCANGQFVIIESESIIDSTYNIEWYKCSKKIRKFLFIIMENSKEPICVLAGGVIGLSLPTFIMTLRTSYSYFTLFYGLSSKETEQ